MRLLQAVFLCLLSKVTLSQQPVHFQISQQQGLPSNTVYNIFQDQKGFLWVATENGLARYNGTFFRKYTTSRVRSSAVSGLSEDNKGRLWLHNFFGEILYLENDTLRKLDSWEEKYSEGFPSIEASGDSLIISSAQKLFYYVISKKIWKDIPISANERVNLNHHLSVNGVRWLCYASPNHTVVVALNGANAHAYKLDAKQYPLTPNVVRLISWQEKLFLFDSSTKNFLELANGQVHDLSAKYNDALRACRNIQNIGDSLLAIMGTNGVYLVNKREERFHLLPQKNISSAIVDKEGSLWVGTLNEGLFYFPALNSFLYPKEKVGLYTKLAPAPLHTGILAGNYKGHIDFIHRDGVIHRLINSETETETQAMLVDSADNKLFIFNNGLHIHDLSNWSHLQELHIAAVKEIVRLDTALALATSAGLYILNATTNKKEIVLSFQRIATLALEKSKGLLWLGTQKGIFFYNLKTKEITQWKDADSFSPGASKLRFLSNGDLAIGTLTNGLYIVRDGLQKNHFTIHHGLPSNKITALAGDFTNLWIGTDNGVVNLKGETNTLTTLTSTKGLASAEVYDMLVTNNKLWISHAAGIQVFTTLLATNKQQPRIHLEAATSNNIRIENPLKGITLPTSSQQLTLEFDVSNALRSQGQAKIVYRIVEINGSKWQVTTLKNATVNYLSLPYGELTFEAKATNEDGIASANIIRFVITVPAPFWKQLWFLATVFILAGATCVLFIFWRFRRTAKVNKLQLENLNQQQALRIAQLTSLRAQMNPHFIFNTMSLIQGKVLNGLKEDADRNIQNFSLLLRKVLDFSGREMIALHEEVEILEKYLAIEKDRFDGSLEFTLTLDDAVKHEMIRIPSLLTQPFVENALRHGLMHKEGVKKLNISFTVKDDALFIYIEDNGIGRKASAEFNKARKKEHNSFALEAYQKRIDLLNSARMKKIELQIIDKQTDFGIPSGTMVIIKVPLET
jgi:ligand-binding sensor domain-containing protein